MVYEYAAREDNPDKEIFSFLIIIGYVGYS